MKQQIAGNGFIAGALLAACLPLRAPAQDAHAGSAAPAVTAPGSGQGDPLAMASAPSKPDDGKLESNTGRTAKYSTGVDEILKMVQAGVSTEVIKTYIEDSPTAYNLTAADIIVLKAHAVPDELTTAMMKRGAALRMQIRQSLASNATPPPTAGSNRRYYRLDPESYDYFQYYYLYPRTLAAANQRFLSGSGFSPGFAPFGYGYYGPLPFWPLPPSAIGRP
jgi:hypothetical protein